MASPIATMCNHCWLTPAAWGSLLWIMDDKHALTGEGHPEPYVARTCPPTHTPNKQTTECRLTDSARTTAPLVAPQAAPASLPAPRRRQAACACTLEQGLRLCMAAGQPSTRNTKQVAVIRKTSNMHTHVAHTHYGRRGARSRSSHIRSGAMQHAHSRA